MEETRHKMKAFERALSHIHEDNFGSHKAVKLVLVDLGLDPPTPTGSMLCFGSMIGS